MAKGRELKGRLRSVENTRKITRTMEMVAASKLKRAADRVSSARPYAAALREVMSSLYSPDLAERFPLLRQPEREARAAVVLITSNRGLAGAFNANLIREARSLLERLDAAGTDTDLYIVGRKGAGYFRYVGRSIANVITDVSDRPSSEDASRLVNHLMDSFVAGGIDALYVVSAKFNSALSTPPTSEQVLPVEPPEATSSRHDYLLFPDAETILDELLPAYVRNQMYKALVETAAGEQGARRTAMKSATDNATEMIGLLRRDYNRSRQAQITQEIAEIVGGAAALE